MGGQACVLYGAAEFSRDTDFAVLADPGNLRRLGRAMRELRARPIAVPPFEEKYLRRGHAAHFRCQAQGCAGLRVDLMAKLRGLPAFPVLWKRRQSWKLGPNWRIEVMGLPDLVRAKKTQRDKDWPMIRRLVEADYFAHRGRPTARRLEFWLQEARTPEILKRLRRDFPAQFAQVAKKRGLLRGVAGQSVQKWEKRLQREEDRERSKDRAYWRPLRREMERLRMAKIRPLG
jgi:hypothetical protein